MKHTVVLFAVAAMLALPASAVNVTFDNGGYTGYWGLGPQAYAPPDSVTMGDGQTSTVVLGMYGYCGTVGSFTIHQNDGVTSVTSNTAGLTWNVVDDDNVVISLNTAPLALNLNGCSVPYGFSDTNYWGYGSIFSGNSVMMPVEFTTCRFWVDNSGNAAFVSRDASGNVSVSGASWLIADGSGIAINPASLVAIKVTHLDATGEVDLGAGTFGMGYIWASGVGPITCNFGDLLVIGGLTYTINDVVGNLAVPTNTKGWQQDIVLGDGTILRFIPEPATMSLLALGGLALLRRRRRG